MKHERIQADQTVPSETYSFESYVVRTRGNMSNGAEQEYPVEVSYRIVGGLAVICNTRCDVELTSWDLERLDEQADAHCADVLADMECEIAPIQGLAA